VVFEDDKADPPARPRPCCASTVSVLLGGGVSQHDCSSAGPARGASSSSPLISSGAAGQVLVFKDIAPAAPTHLLLIPKRREGLTQLREATPDHAGVLGHLMVTAAKVAKEQALGDYRLVINDGTGAGQAYPRPRKWNWLKPRVGLSICC